MYNRATFLVCIIPTRAKKNQLPMKLIDHISKYKSHAYLFWKSLQYNQQIFFILKAI